MLLNVNLVGHNAPWRFPGTERLDRWVSDCPWSDQGGIFGLRVRPGEHVSLLQEQLARHITAAPTVVPIVESRTFPNGTPVTSIRDIVGEFVGAGSGLSRREWLEVVASELSARRLVLLLDVSAVEEPLSSWWDDAASLSNDLRKTLETAALTVVVLGEGLPVDDSFDFRAGEPLPDISWLHTPLVSAWRAYVHRRIAWEAGGFLPRALAWSRNWESSVSEADDGLLEGWFTSRAEEEWATLSTDLQDLVQRYSALAGEETPPAAHLLAPLETSLKNAGLLWRPYGDVRLHLLPWVARVLLNRGVSPASRPMLRGELAVPGLTGLLFARCLEVEARRRARLRPSGMPKPETTNAFQNIQHRSTKSAARYYPENHPAPPDDVWWVASLGEVLSRVPPQAPHRDRLYDLLGLRNAVAHGHPCGWQAILELRQLEATL
jgi:hypothetical protein